jgi:hypothetical protein
MRGDRGGATLALVTLEEFVVAVEEHRRQMAPLVSVLAEASGAGAVGELVGLLEDSDRELGRLCHRLGQHLDGFDDRSGRQEAPPWK